AQHVLTAPAAQLADPPHLPYLHLPPHLHKNGAIFYGLILSHIQPSKPPPTLNPPQFNKQAAYHFLLAFPEVEVTPELPLDESRSKEAISVQSM
ncbi:hypothetical protein C0995_005231, partial [Termitomyces sp. Mi166